MAARFEDWTTYQCVIRLPDKIERCKHSQRRFSGRLQRLVWDLQMAMANGVYVALAARMSAD